MGAGLQLDRQIDKQRQIDRQTESDQEYGKEEG